MAITAQQIVTDVCQICKAPAYTAQAGRFLNQVLAALAQDYDFNFLRTLATINVTGIGGAIPYDLPSDYLRMREQPFFQLNGEPMRLNQIDLSEYDGLYNQTSAGLYPYSFATDVSVSPAQIYLYPSASTPLTLSIRYQKLPADIATPETSSSIPWFPHQNYLVTRTAAELMKITDDTRRMEFLAEAENILRKYLALDDDDEGFAKTVTLDNRLFRTVGGAKPTKQLGSP